MKSHRTIWRLTGVLVGVATLVVVLGAGREAWLRNNLGDIPAPPHDHRVDRMIALLEDDPRARESETREAVQQVAALVGDSASDSPEVHYALGLVHHSFGDERFEDAEAAYRRAIALRPDWNWAHNRLAILLFETGREPEADASWARATEIDPNWSRPYNDRAILYRRSMRYADALAAVEKAMQLDPQSPEPAFNLGVILDTLGYAELALRAYETAIERDPTKAPAYFNIACGYGRQGDLHPAVFYLQRAIALNERFWFDAWVDPDFEPIRYYSEFTRVLDATSPLT